MLAPQHAVSLCKSVGSPARWAAYEKVLPSLHAGPTVSFYYWDLIFCVRYNVAPPHCAPQYNQQSPGASWVSLGQHWSMTEMNQNSVE